MITNEYWQFIFEKFQTELTLKFYILRKLILFKSCHEEKKSDVNPTEKHDGTKKQCF